MVGDSTLGLSTATGFAYTDHNTTHTFRQQVNFAAGGDTIVFTLAAIVANDDQILYDSGLSETGENLIVLTGEDNIAVFESDGITEADFTFVNNADGTVTITVTEGAAGDGWFYQVTTFDVVNEGTGEITTNNEFSAIQLVAAEGTESFKLGIFSYGVDDPGDPVSLSYDIVGTDGDGDTVTGTIDAALYPDAITTTGDSGDNVMTGTAANDVLLGLGGMDTLDGGGGDDILVGDGGIDTLIGNAGDDVLFGGSDGDTLTGDNVGGDGSAGMDTFVIEGSDINVPTNVGGDNTDTITDFNTTADTLDLSDIFADANIASPVEGVHYQFSAVNTDDNIATDEAAVHIDLTGTSDFSGPAVVVLLNVNSDDLNSGNVDV